MLEHQAESNPSRDSTRSGGRLRKYQYSKE